MAVFDAKRNGWKTSDTVGVVVGAIVIALVIAGCLQSIQGQRNNSTR